MVVNIQERIYSTRSQQIHTYYIEAFSFEGIGTTRILRTLKDECGRDDETSGLMQHDGRQSEFVQATTASTYLQTQGDYRFPRKQLPTLTAILIDSIFRIGGCVKISFSRFKMLQHAVVMTRQQMPTATHDHVVLTRILSDFFLTSFIERETSRTRKAQCN